MSGPLLKCDPQVQLSQEDVHVEPMAAVHRVHQDIASLALSWEHPQETGQKEESRTWREAGWGCYSDYHGLSVEEKERNKYGCFRYFKVFSLTTAFHPVSPHTPALIHVTIV
jgi:hypothetical protein